MSTESVDDILAHYGVKGMRWGVRRGSGTPTASSSPSTGKAGATKPPWQSKPSGKSGGMAVAPAAPKLSRRQARKAKRLKDMSPEAVEYKAIRAKAKEKGVDSLSNSDLKKVNERFNLQANYNKNFPKKKNPLVEYAIDQFLSENGERKINTFVGARNPDAAVAVKYAIDINRSIRKAKKSNSKKDDKD